MRDIYENEKRGTNEFPFARYDFNLNQNNLTVTQTHFHNEIEIIYVEKGSINLLLEGDSHILESGDIAFINPNEYHAIKTTEGLLSYSAFVIPKELITFPPTHFFQIEFTSKIFSGKMKMPSILKNSKRYHNEIFPDIRKIYTLNSSKDPEILSLLLHAFSVLLKNDLLIKVNTPNNKIPEYVKLCIEFISENCDKVITLEQLSELAHISSNYLCYIFKATTGLTPIEHLQVIRIKKGCRLLLETDLSVEEIALKCGFKNVGYFIKVFKKQNALTPHMFRKKMSI